jgi:hypothetical protein
VTGKTGEESECRLPEGVFSPQKTLIMTEIVPRYFLVHIHNLAVFFAVPRKKK